MKNLWTLGLLLALTGCRPAAAPPPATNQAPSAVGVADVLTQRPVLEAGQRAAATIRKVTEQEQKQLQDTQEP